MMFKRARRKAIKLIGERSSALDLARGRLVLMSGVFVVVYMLLAVRALDVSVIQGSVQVSDSAPVVMSGQNSEVRRADILDRNGVILATTLKTASLFADPHLVSDADKAAKGLVKIFPDMSYGEVLQKLQGDSRFVWLKRNVLPAEQYAVLELGEPGLDFRYESRRIYPQGPLAAHFVGYTNVDNSGLAGVERSFDNFLSEGRDLKLTIDVRLQHILRRELARAMKEFSAQGGAGVIVDVGTGEVLAGSSLPDFDPHDAGGAKDAEKFNRLTLGVYELGSVFKIFSTAAFLEAHDVPMSTTFDAREPIKVGRFTINDYHAEDRILTIPEVFMYSSNIGSAMMGQSVGTEKLQAFYSDLGLLSAMDFEIREIGAPLVPSPWREVNTLTASYGHGLATTPLQMTAAVASIVNGGFLIRPTLVMDEDRGESQKSEDIRIVSPQTAHRMRQLLRLVVTDGTGKNADVPGYRVGGKTGTAEKIGGRGYDRKRLMSSFVGVFPMEDPRYAVFIIVDEPKGTKASWGYATGGWVAAPAVSRVVASMASVLGIPAAPTTAQNEVGDSLKQYISVKSHE